MAKNILICDDAAFMRMMIKDILTKNGYNIAGEAENGKIAVEKYAETKPDLVMMDITMPEMDVFRLLRKSRKLIREQRLLCVLQWVSRPWLSNQSSQAQRISLLSLSRRTEFLRQLKKY